MLIDKNKIEINPVTPDLIKPAVEILQYFKSIYGEKVIMGQNRFEHADKVYKASGKYPAIVSKDLNGWHEELWSETYKSNLKNVMDRLTRFWKDEGGIPSLAWHWAIPPAGEGTYEATKYDYYPFAVGEAVTEGTQENELLMEDIKKHADYLEILCEREIPLLFRPLHEIDGGWFWWTDHDKPENTAKLWKILFDYLVKERKFNNLIWVYSAGVRVAALDYNDLKDPEAIKKRKRYYPGSDYVDISGIDIYDQCGWGDYHEKAFIKAYEIMNEIAPDKMQALCECAGVPDPDIMEKEGPRWLWTLPWWVRDDKDYNPPEWVKKCYNYEIAITLDKLPDWDK